jgi:hypothetical protein
MKFIEISDSLEKAKRMSRLIPKKIFVTREGKSYQTTVWVLPEEANSEKFTAQHDLFADAEINEKIEAEKAAAANQPKLVIEVKKETPTVEMPASLKNAPVKSITATITAKGRKYYKAKFPGKNWEFQVAINKASENFEIGSQVTFNAKEYKEYSKYGTKTTYYPVEGEEVSYVQGTKDKAEIERWLGYVKETARSKGYLYRNGYDKLKELGIEKYPEYNEQLKNILKTLKVRELRETADRYLGYIKKNLAEYWYKKGEATVQDAIDKLSAEGIDASAYVKRLEELRTQYQQSLEDAKKAAEAKKQAEYRKRLGGYEGPVINVAYGSGYLDEPLYKDTVIRNPNKFLGIKGDEEPDYLYVIYAESRYYPEDGMSFGVGDESGYVYSAITRPATEEEAAPLVAEDKLKEEKRKAFKERKQVVDYIKKNGDRPGFKEGEEVSADGEEYATHRGDLKIYGGGDWFLIDDKKWIWYIQNNGADGDNWSWNNVRIGGAAGAIGWRIPYDKDIAEKILQIHNVLNTKRARPV